MVIFNADGSEPAMCGNGIRCVAHYSFKHNSSLSEVAIETQAGVFRCRKMGGEIAVDLGVPTVVHFPVVIDDREVYVVNTGVPHAVVFVEDLDQILVGEMGRLLRFDPRFAPEGVNVNFAKIGGNGQLALRTYERGIEAETLACGTGAAAVAFAAMKLKQCSGPISILTRSLFSSSLPTYRETMRYSFPDNGTIEMMGSAAQVFEGVIEI
jgi:diaminopimelate epimerase